MGVAVTRLRTFACHAINRFVSGRNTVNATEVIFVEPLSCGNINWLARLVSASTLWAVRMLSHFERWQVELYQVDTP